MLTLKQMTPDNINEFYQNRLDSFLQLKSHEVFINGQPFDDYCELMNVSTELPKNFRLSTLKISDETKDEFLLKKITTSNITKEGIPLTEQYFINGEIDYFLMKKKDINSMEDEAIQIDFYIDYLNKKYLEFNNSEPQQETKTDTRLLKNKYHKIFSNDLGFTLFNEWHNQHKDETKILAIYSFIYIALEKDNLVVCSQPGYINFLSQLDHPIIIDKVDSRQQGKTNKKYKLYKSNKMRFEA